MRIHSASVNHAFIAPNIVEQPIAFLHAAPALHQCAQQFELKTGQMHLPAVNANFVARRIDRNRTGAQTLVGFFAAPEDCANSQHNFAWAERFCDVIIGAEFQTHNAIDLFRFRRQHENRHPGRCSVAF